MDEITVQTKRKIERVFFWPFAFFNFKLNFELLREIIKLILAFFLANLH